MNRLNHFRVGDARRENAPAAHSVAASASLDEAAPLAACGCRSSWHLSEYVDEGDGHVLCFGWWLSCTHSHACRRANA
jgi:hypothetical protein